MAIDTGMTMGVLTPLVSDITPEGLSLVADVTADELGLADTDATLRGPVSISLDLAHADEMISVTGVLEGTVVRQCVRCLKEYEEALAFSVHAAFARERPDPMFELDALFEQRRKIVEQPDQQIIVQAALDT